MIGKPHILSPSDVQRGIQALAAFLLGDASEYMQLVTANNLAPPYLTLNASEVYGPPTADLSLASPLSEGSDQISISGQPQTINQIYLSYVGASGLVSEAVQVASYDGNIIQLGSPLKNAYPLGTRLQLFSSYLLNNHVLLPGDTLFVPVQLTQGSLNITNQQTLADTFGSDFADPVSFANGDFATVTGLATLVQRIRVALKTAMGSLPLHPEWGSKLYTAIGTPSQSVKWSTLVADCLLRLPEVSGVQNLQVNVQGTTVYISCIVETNTSDATIQLQNEGFSLIAA